MNGRQMEAFRNALVSGFRSYAELEMMVQIELDESLEAITGRGSLKEVAFNLIQWAVSQIWCASSGSKCTRETQMGLKIR
jgi:hypothetical protein